MKTARFPFLFGAQYYRAPTPDSSCWEEDHLRMAALGFNSVKYWVQWRWSHRRDNRFVFDDISRLMDLAGRHGLAVTLNVIFDVAPHWLYERYPDARQIMNHGRVIEPENVAHRQIGGSPGPSYTHPGALEERRRFLAATIEHFKDHPALDMWDLWNEPELCFNQRTPDLATLADYNPINIAAFRIWLAKKYMTLDRLNTVWGRCYEQWGEVEAPRTAQTITDFIDWREFHIESLTAEARWRFELARERDPQHIVFLHTVPNLMSCWNSVSACADDFELAALCDVYGSTGYNGGGQNLTQLTSAANGRIVYNTESHINFGLTNIHQGMVDLPQLLANFLPQIGMGVRGFQFWQFRSEVLGLEAPAWGVVKPDGSDRPITAAIGEFWEKLHPYTETIARCPAPLTEVGIWKSRKNEIFHFAIHGKLDPLIESIGSYGDALYTANIPFRFVDDAALASGDLLGLKLLILPSPYYLTQPEMDALTQWVKGGGILWSEAHLGAYNGTTGRHSMVVPGGGLAAAWGICEEESCSSFRLDLEQSEVFSGSMSEDVKKILLTTGTTGGKYFPIQTSEGRVIWGADRYAMLSHSGGVVLGTFDGKTPTLLLQSVGQGCVYYHGTNLGEGSAKDSQAFRLALDEALQRAGIAPILKAHSSHQGAVHLDHLLAPDGATFLVVQNTTALEQTFSFQAQGKTYRGLWSGCEICGDGTPQALPASTCDFFVISKPILG